MQLNGLIVSGFLMKENDGSAYWQFADTLKTIPGVTFLERAWNDLNDEDLVGRDFVICYSWGVASVFKAFERMKQRGLTLPVLIILAGVPRGFLQCIAVTANKGWQVPDFVAEAICLQVDSIPVSWPIANAGPNRVNVVLTEIPGNDHINVQSSKEFHDLVFNIIAAEAQANAAGPTG